MEVRMQNKYTPKDVQRFWNKVDKSGGEDACWIWMGYRLPSGYGQVSHKDRTRYAHRVSFEIAFGIIPDGLLVCHKCDNPGCVNPNHLFSGSNLDNANDRDRKKRRTALNGEKATSHKLTDAQVSEIRKLRLEGTTSAIELAKTFGVSAAYIYCLVSGKRRV
jgi:hypothetical protein